MLTSRVRDPKIAANAKYHSAGMLKHTTVSKPRYCSQVLRDDITNDIRWCRDQIHSDHPVALDCLTGDGALVPLYLKAGFSTVVGVDMSTDEIKRARRDHPNQTFEVSEIGDHFHSHRETYDFIYFNSLHHIPDYLDFVARCCRALKSGGFYYSTEKENATTFRKLMVKADDHLFLLLASPSKWLRRVGPRIGLFKNSASTRAWSLANQAEVHAQDGLDHKEIIRTLEMSGCRIEKLEYEIYAQTFFFHILRKLLPLPNTVRIIARKR